MQMFGQLQALRCWTPTLNSTIGRLQFLEIGTYWNFKCFCRCGYRHGSSFELKLTCVSDICAEAGPANGTTTFNLNICSAEVPENWLLCSPIWLGSNLQFKCLGRCSSLELEPVAFQIFMQGRSIESDFILQLKRLGRVLKIGLHLSLQMLGTSSGFLFGHYSSRGGSDFQGVQLPVLLTATGEHSLSILAC